MKVFQIHGISITHQSITLPLWFENCTYAHAKNQNLSEILVLTKYAQLNFEN